MGIWDLTLENGQLFIAMCFELTLHILDFGLGGQSNIYDLFSLTTAGVLLLLTIEVRYSLFSKPRTLVWLIIEAFFISLFIEAVMRFVWAKAFLYTDYSLNRVLKMNAIKYQNVNPKSYAFARDYALSTLKFISTFGMLLIALQFTTLGNRILPWKKSNRSDIDKRFLRKTRALRETSEILSNLPLLSNTDEISLFSNGRNRDMRGRGRNRAFNR